jgi:hypothetical protein
MLSRKTKVRKIGWADTGAHIARNHPVRGALSPSLSDRKINDSSQKPFLTACSFRISS